MNEKIPRSYTYAIVVLVFGIVAVLAWNYLQGPKEEPGGVRGASGERATGLEEKERQIQTLENQIARLRKELDETSSKVAALQARLAESKRALSPAEQKVRGAPSPVAPQAPSPPAAAEIAAKATESQPGPGPRRPAELGSYEVIRSTDVFAEPAETARKVSSIKRGTRVTVVGSAGDWLEVRSKHGNPPGFIRRDDAMFVERQN